MVDGVVEQEALVGAGYMAALFLGRGHPGGVGIVKAKRDPDWLSKSLAGVDRGTVVGERWFIEEYRKPWFDSGYYGEGNMPETPNVEWSEFFDTESQARAHMKRVEPRNNDHALRVRHQQCWETIRIERTWRG